MNMIILELNRIDELNALADDATRTSHRMVQRLCDEWRDGSNRFDQPGEAVLVAERDQRIVGVCGLNRDPYANDDAAGRVRRLYVHSEFRRLAVGRALVEAIIARCHGSFGTLHVRTDDPKADAFSRALGFDCLEGDAHCTHVREIQSPHAAPILRYL